MSYARQPSPAHMRLAPGRFGRATRVGMKILRHSQIAMTMEVYSKVPTANARSALKQLSRQLDG